MLVEWSVWAKFYLFDFEITDNSRETNKQSFDL